MQIKIDRVKKSVPLYVQIAENFIAQIESGELGPGSRLPGERELSEVLSVQRETVREALRVLENQGLIERRHGSGTYVAQPKIERDASRLFPFTWMMQQKGYKPGARVIQMEKILCNSAVALELDIPVSAVIFHYERVRTLNQEPVVIENTFIPADLFPDLDRFNLNLRSVYEVMETEYGTQVTHASQSLEAVVATEFEAENLGIKKGDPLMLERRLTYDQNNRRVEFSKDVFRGDRFRFMTEHTPVESIDYRS
jgi:GntR family transcriptional regulator